MSSTDSTPPKKKPGRGPEAAAREAGRRERLSAALRENLKKRKAQDRAKRASASDGGDGAD